MVAREIGIRGRVHNVGYRLFLMSEAEKLFMDRFDAWNVLVGGEQELVVLVGGEEEKIERFVEFARSSFPVEASVESVEVREYGEEVRSIDCFRWSFMVSQLAKMVEAGVGMLKKQDAMLEKQDETIGVVREESGKIRGLLGEKVLEDVGWMKNEIAMVKATLSRVKEKVGVE